MTAPKRSPVKHWAITIHGWGTLYAVGTEAQAEEWRAHKANWERGVGRKREADDVEMAREKFCNLGDLL